VLTGSAEAAGRFSAMEMWQWVIKSLPWRSCYNSCSEKFYEAVREKGSLLCLKALL